MEDKQKICDALLDALKLTDNQADLSDIEYDEVKETATLYWLDQNLSTYSKTVNVAMDGGTAMIRDIMSAID